MAKKPIVLTEQQIKELPKYTQAGLNLDQIASILEISSSVLDDIIKRQPEVKWAIEKGRSDAILQVGSTAFQQAVTGKNPAMTMFYLKCRAGWSEKSQEERDAGNAIPLTPDNIAELCRLAREQK